MTKWIDCLKEYNRNKRVWCIPRKGTRSYAKVMQCVNGDKNAFVKKKKLKVVEKFEDEKPRDIQENPDLVVQMKRATINDVPQDVMNNIMGQFLDVKDKANLASVGIKVKLTDDEEEKKQKINRIKLIHRVWDKIVEIDKSYIQNPLENKSKILTNYNKARHEQEYSIKRLGDKLLELTLTKINGSQFNMNKITGNYYIGVSWDYPPFEVEAFNSKKQFNYDDLKDYLLIKPFSKEKELLELLDKPSPNFTTDYKKSYDEEQKFKNEVKNEVEKRKDILKKLLDWRIEYLVPYPAMPNKYKYDFFTEINKVLKKLTKISFDNSVSIQGEKNLNNIKHNSYNRYKVWKINKKPEWNRNVIEEVKIKKNIPPKLMSEINYLLTRYTTAT